MTPRTLCIVALLGFAIGSPTRAHAGTDVADLSISVDDGVDIVQPDGPVTWMITVHNDGPGDAIAQVADTFPDGVTGMTWTCVPSGNASCAADGVGPIFDLAFIPSGESLIYAASGTVVAPLNSTLSDTALVGALNGIVDPDTANNISTDTDTVAYTDPPIVVKLDSVASPLDSCGLPDGIESKASITQVAIDFSEPMYDPAGDTSPVDVTNSANYLILEAGADDVFSTADCATPVGGDDRVVEISGVDYDESSYRAALHVDANAMALPSGSYRVIACGGGLANVSGVLLDGAATGTAGSDFRSDFRVLGTNLLVNPNFDHAFAMGWEQPFGRVSDDADDADGFVSSGSISTAGTGGDSQSGIFQCVSGISGGLYSLSVRDLNDLAGQFATLYADDMCEVAYDPFTSLFTAFPVATSNGWDVGQAGPLRVPQGTFSFLVEARMPDVAVGTTARMDSFSLRREDDDVIFRTGMDFPTSCAAAP